MKKCLSFILTMICIFGLVGCHNSPRVSENSGQYQVYLKSDIRTEVLSSTSASEEELNSYLETQYIDQNHSENVVSVCMVRASNFFECEWVLQDLMQIRSLTNEVREKIFLFGLQDGQYVEKYESILPDRICLG